jgi:hypothetical protein
MLDNTQRAIVEILQILTIFFQEILSCFSEASIVELAISWEMSRAFGAIIKLSATETNCDR